MRQRFSMKSYFRAEFVEEHKGYEVVVYHRDFQTIRYETIPWLLGISMEEWLEESKKYNSQMKVILDDYDEIRYKFPVFSDKKDAMKFKEVLEQLMYLSILSGQCPLYSD